MLLRAFSFGSAANMWGDATSAVADVGFFPQNLHWIFRFEDPRRSIRDLQPGLSLLPSFELYLMLVLLQATAVL
jgi:hypothetical protein